VIIRLAWARVGKWVQTLEGVSAPSCIARQHLHAGHAQLLQGVSKEANLALAMNPIVAQLGAIPAWMQPVLEDVVSEGAAISARALHVLLHFRTCDTGVYVCSGIPALGLFSRVREGAGGPVVAKPFGAGKHLEAEHSKFICAVQWTVFVDIGGKLCSLHHIITFSS